MFFPLSDYCFIVPVRFRESGIFFPDTINLVVNDQMSSLLTKSMGVHTSKQSFILSQGSLSYSGPTIDFHSPHFCLLILKTFLFHTMSTPFTSNLNLFPSNCGISLSVHSDRDYVKVTEVIRSDTTV